MCARHSQRVLRPLEEHDIFANLASKWLSIALDRQTRLTIDLDRFAGPKEAPVRVKYRGFFLCTAIGSFWPLAGEPSSFSENRHYELALSIVVSRIVLFELIEH